VYLLTNSAKIMEDIAEVLLNIPEQERCTDSAVLEFTSMFKFLPTIF